MIFRRASSVDSPENKWFLLSDMGEQHYLSTMSTMSSLTYLILSTSGKPIFSTSSIDISHSGLTSTLLSFSGTVTPNILSSLETENEKYTFLKKGSIYLLAHGQTPYSSTYITLTLEILYTQILFTLTSKVHSIFQKSPNFDLRSMLGATDVVMKGLMGQGGGGYLVGGVECLRMEVEVRDEVTRCIKQISNHVENTLYGLLLTHSTLITLLQPSNPSLHLQTSDLHLLTNFISQSSSTLMSSESWVPICLPGFNETGFLYMYVCCLHQATELFLVLVSSENRPEQFFQFQNARAAVVHALGLKQRTAGKIIHQHGFEDDRESSLSNPPTPPTQNNSSPLIQSILTSTSQKNSHLLQTYTSVGVLHFLYRLNVDYKEGGEVVFKVENDLGFPFVDGGEGETGGKFWLVTGRS
ncbi:hypothetical protein TL16_g02667 [Triparma laevis f. inornata]|uniref:Vacuolar fusion protein MON1 n=1 Tax=Triparma laevis f. inornata TaxID=1714386 RepID=A0A9W6ZWM7_9STRA|nr:hypothetical protein TL16_g02667 [Triparma laevis f. inornata]